MVDGADHVVEVDPAVEEAPGHVTHQRTQVVAGVDRVAHRAAVARGPADVNEVFVAAETEATELEGLVAQCRMGLRGFDAHGVGGGVRGHGSLRSRHWGCSGAFRRAQAVWQISAQRSMLSSPLLVPIRHRAG